jgi:hypothetical protein
VLKATATPLLTDCTSELTAIIEDLELAIV